MYTFSLSILYQSPTPIATPIAADAPPHGIDTAGDGFPQGCPLGLDPLHACRTMAQKGITLYCAGCEPAIMAYRDFFMGLAHVTGGQYVPLSHANTLSKVCSLLLFLACMTICVPPWEVLGRWAEVGQILTKECLVDQWSPHLLISTGKRTECPIQSDSVCDHTSDYNLRLSNLLITSMITDLHRTTRSPLTN